MRASTKKNEVLKELIKELQETDSQKVKSQADLLASINRLTKQVEYLKEDNRKTIENYSSKLMNC